MMQIYNKQENIGKKVGYIFGYFLFTTILFLALKLIKKMPDDWGYFHIMGTSLIIVIVGVGVGELLK